MSEAKRERIRQALVRSWSGSLSGIIASGWMPPRSVGSRPWITWLRVEPVVQPRRQGEPGREGLAMSARLRS